MEEYTHLCVFLRDFPVFAANEDFITSVGESNHNLQTKYHMHVSQCMLVHSKTESTVSAIPCRSIYVAIHCSFEVFPVISFSPKSMSRAARDNHFTKYPCAIFLPA
jgi:hypothetical protein